MGSWRIRCLLPPYVKQRAMPIAPIASSLQQQRKEWGSFLLATLCSYIVTSLCHGSQCLAGQLLAAVRHALRLRSRPCETCAKCHAHTALVENLQARQLKAPHDSQPVCILYHCSLLAEGTWLAAELILESHTANNRDDLFNKLLWLLLRLQECAYGISSTLLTRCIPT